VSQAHVRQDRVVQEFQGVDLGDPRRERRVKSVASRLASRPEASLPVAMGEDAALEGAYRLLSNELVTLEQLVQPHVQHTAERVRNAGRAYAIHDTTGFSFGGEMRRTGLGSVNNATDQGFRAQVTLAVSADGRREPLGLLAIGTRARPQQKERGHSEVERWSQGMSVAEAQVGQGHLIHLADRESDVYMLIAKAHQSGWSFIFRAAHDRALLTEMPGEVARLYTAARSKLPKFRVTVPLCPRGAKGRPGKQRNAFPPRAGRIAELCFSARSVTLKRSTSLPHAIWPSGVPVNVVRVWEPQPPNGAEPVEWLLLTSESVETDDEIKAVVDGYRTRWVIEEFFCAVKTGCGFERRQLESAHGLFNMLAFCLVVAYVLLLMRTLAREDTRRPAAEVLSPQQLACLRLLSPKGLGKEPTAREALLRIAALGGHIKNNGEPGWRTLSRGWSDLLRAEQIYLLIQSGTSDQS
jgi:Transposase DNA-binding/Transposase DDE domain